MISTSTYFQVRENVERIKACQDTQELVQITTHHLRVEIDELTRLTRRRFADLANSDDQDNLQSAMALLKTTTPLLVSGSRVCISNRQSENAALVRFAVENRQFACDEMNDALDGVSRVISGQRPSESVGVALHSRLDPLVADLEEFKVCVCCRLF